MTMEKYSWKAELHYAPIFEICVIAMSEDEARTKVMAMLHRVESFQTQFQRIEEDLLQVFDKMKTLDNFIHKQHHSHVPGDLHDQVALGKAIQEQQVLQERQKDLSEERTMIERQCLFNPMLHAFHTNIQDFTTTLPVICGDDTITLAELITRTPTRSPFHEVTIYTNSDLFVNHTQGTMLLFSYIASDT